MSALGWDFSCWLEFVEHQGLMPGWGRLSLLLAPKGNPWAIAAAACVRRILYFPSQSGRAGSQELACRFGAGDEWGQHISWKGRGEPPVTQVTGAAPWGQHLEGFSRQLGNYRAMAQEPSHHCNNGAGSAEWWG